MSQRDEDFDDPLPQDMDDDDSADLPMMSCPSCRKAVVEDTQQCPHCGEWIIPSEGGAKRRWLFILAVVLMLLVVMLWIIR